VVERLRLQQHNNHEHSWWCAVACDPVMRRVLEANYSYAEHGKDDSWNSMPFWAEHSNIVQCCIELCIMQLMNNSSTVHSSQAPPLCSKTHHQNVVQSRVLLPCKVCCGLGLSPHLLDCKTPSKYTQRRLITYHKLKRQMPSKEAYSGTTSKPYRLAKMKPGWRRPRRGQELPLSAC